MSNQNQAECEQLKSVKPVFVRRQSPDWWALARDYRSGQFIEPSRFIPGGDIPGFPNDVQNLVAQWNERFSIDFFTCRGILSNYSCRSVKNVPNSQHFTENEIDEIIKCADTSSFFLFFHDDDDLFAPALTSVVAKVDAAQWDTIVFPLFRASADTFTFVRANCEADFIWRRHENFHFRFQTNNYGLSSRLCSHDNLAAMKDHIHASAFASKESFNELVLPSVVSATIKTPLSASRLPALFANPEHIESQFKKCIEIFAAPGLPPDYAWLAEPLSGIAQLLEAVCSGAGYEALPVCAE